MYHEPVCCKCQLPMYTRKNGVDVIDIEEDYVPYKIWRADKWRCFRCKTEIIVGFSREPIIEKYHEGFDTVCKAISKERHTTECRFGVQGRYQDEAQEWEIENNEDSQIYN